MQATYVKALMRRAEAYEQLEKYDLALQDVNAVIATEDTPAAG
jgi:F0F1-type ATP synthase delta subunit